LIKQHIKNYFAQHCAEYSNNGFEDLFLSSGNNSGDIGFGEAYGVYWSSTRSGYTEQDSTTTWQLITFTIDYKVITVQY
jgi:hypothetical protein